MTAQILIIASGEVLPFLNTT